MKKYIICLIIWICILRFLTFVPIFHDFAREPYIFEKENNNIAYADYERFSPIDYSYKIKLNGRNYFSKPVGYIVSFASETLSNLTIIIDCDMQSNTEFREENEYRGYSYFDTEDNGEELYYYAMNSRIDNYYYCVQSHFNKTDLSDEENDKLQGNAKITVKQIMFELIDNYLNKNEGENK